MKIGFAYYHNNENSNTISSSCTNYLRETDFKKCYIHRSYQPVDQREYNLISA